MSVKDKTKAIRIVAVILAIGLIVAGSFDGGYTDVKNKAIRICYECIGIG